MSKFDGLDALPMQSRMPLKKSSKFDGLDSFNPSKKPAATEGDSWFWPKMALEVAASTPNMITSLGSTLVANGGPPPNTGILPMDYADETFAPVDEEAVRVPTVNQGLGKLFGKDLEARPSSKGQKFAGDVLGYTQLARNPVKASGKVLKIGKNLLSSFAKPGVKNKLGSLYGYSKNIAAGAAKEAAPGVVASTAKELEFNPLVADLVIAPALTASGSSLLNKFSKENRTLGAKKKVAGTFEEQMGGRENVDKALEAISKHKQTPSPINIQMNTPQVVDDVGLSRFYQTQGANSQKLANQAIENNNKIRDSLHEFGPLYLPESERGSLIRTPFVKEFEDLSEFRSKRAKDSYEKLRQVKEGVNPENALKFLKEEAGFAGLEQKKKYDKYAKFLEGSPLSPEREARLKQLQGELNQIETHHQSLGPEALSQLKAPIKLEISNLQKEKHLLPAQLEDTLSGLNDKINSSLIQGKNNEALKYGQLKEELIRDLDKVPEAARARKMYAEDSKAINEIEKTPLLHNFVKKNKGFSKPDGFMVPDEKIPTAILNASLADTKALMKKIKDKPETLKLVKGAIIDDFAKKIENTGNNLSPAQAKKLVYDKFNREKWKEVFSKDEMNKLDHIVDVLGRKASVDVAGKISGISNTFQQFSINNDINKGVDLAAKASGIPWFAKEALKYTLDKPTKALVNKFAAPSQKAIIEEALLSPDAFKELFNAKPKSLLENFKPKFKDRASKAVLPALINNSREER